MRRLSHHITLRPLLSLALCAAAACASGGSSTASGSGEPSAARRTTRGTSDLITAEEIAKTTATNTYHAIELLRPTFLRSRGPTSVTRSLSVAVYVDGQHWGEATALRNLPANNVLSIRRLSAAEAQTRYGVDNTAGAIDVTTRSGGRP